jgi:hypothetical protein
MYEGGRSNLQNKDALLPHIRIRYLPIAMLLLILQSHLNRLPPELSPRENKLCPQRPDATLLLA